MGVLKGKNGASDSIKHRPLTGDPRLAQELAGSRGQSEASLGETCSGGGEGSQVEIKWMVGLKFM